MITVPTLLLLGSMTLVILLIIGLGARFWPEIKWTFFDAPVVPSYLSGGMTR